MNELDKFIEKACDSINTIGITDPISESYLKEICEEYLKIKENSNEHTNRSTLRR